VRRDIKKIKTNVSRFEREAFNCDNRLSSASASLARGSVPSVLTNGTSVNDHGEKERKKKELTLPHSSLPAHHLPRNPPRTLPKAHEPATGRL